MNRPRLAVIGAGVIGAMHARAAVASGQGTLVAICDPDAARAQVAQDLGAAFYTDLDSLLDDADIQAAVVATPTQTHLDVARRMAARGIALIVEKPIAGNLADARAIIELEAAHGVPIGVGHHRRHNPLIERARTVVLGGTLGRLVGVNALWALNKHDGYFAIEWHTQPGAGPVLSNLIHDLDALRAVCGEIVRVSARTRAELRGLSVEDTMAVMLEFECGALGTILASDAVASPWAWEVTSGEYAMFPAHDESCYHFLGTDASLEFPRMRLWRHAGDRSGTWFDPLEPHDLDGDSGTPLERQIGNLCAMALGSAPPVVSTRDAARSLACALAVLESARTGDAVTPDFEGL